MNEKNKVIRARGLTFIFTGSALIVDYSTELSKEYGTIGICNKLNGKASFSGWYHASHSFDLSRGGLIVGLLTKRVLSELVAVVGIPIAGRRDYKCAKLGPD